jgi:hypothetical protein
MGKNHQFWLVKTQLELGLIFRTRIRLGTQFLILLMYGTGIKRERERERYIYIYNDCNQGKVSVLVWVSKNWTGTRSDFQKKNQNFFQNKT